MTNIPCVCVCVCVYYTSSLSIISGHVGCYHILAIVHYVAVNTAYSNFKFVFLFPLGKYPEVKLLNYMVVLFLMF